MRRTAPPAPRRSLPAFPPGPRTRRPGCFAARTQLGRNRRALAGWLLAAALATAVVAAARPAQALEVPQYHLTVQVDLAAHTIRGELELELDPADPRLGAALWLHLPPNRFLEEDLRGRRRDLDSLPFATHFQSDDRFDAIWPAGFDPGGIAIERIETDGGLELPFELKSNPLIPQGFSVRDGLLWVPLGAAPGVHRFRIRFTTTLPNRYWDGWSSAGVLAEQWYPLLANWRDGAWEFDVHAPRGGRYAADITVSEAGQLFLGHGWAVAVEPGEPVHIPLDSNPLRAFALIFQHTQLVEVRHDYDLSLYAYYQPGHERLGQLALQVARQFRQYVRDVYHLPAPQTRIAMVEVDTPPGDIQTVGSLVLIPRVYFQNSSMLDRVFLAQISRAIAQVWFGEAVWSNRDTQSWLHLGLSGYLALDFFHSRYGWNAGIHNLMDWLQPKYREHFFEAPVRELIRMDEDAPLMISQETYPRSRTARLVVHNKAPLVLRSLYFTVGHDAFAHGLNALYFRHRYQEVTDATFRDELGEIAGMDLHRFFADWFYDTPRINFAVGNWSQEPTPLGYRVHAHVSRSGPPPLPVSVRVVTVSGQSFEQRWEGNDEEAMLTFSLPGPVASITIDPEEFWLELDRKDNHTEILYRVRPLFDWSKQREYLLTLKGKLGGNAIDGNFYGLGVKLTINENNELTVMPVYGDRTGLRNYLVHWDWRQFLVPKLDISLALTHLGGASSQSVKTSYTAIDTDEYRVSVGAIIAAAAVGQEVFVDLNGTTVSQEGGRANNIALFLELGLKPGLHYGNELALAVVDSRPNYRSEFEFTTYTGTLDQVFLLGSSHIWSLALLRAGTVGTPPLQLRHELGGPGRLPGYPRQPQLSNEEVAVAQASYGYVVTRRVLGSTAQVRRITAFLFGDVGRGWNNDEHHDTRPQRQDLGVGLEFRFDVLRLAEFPIRLDLAYPVRDEQYTKPQFILFGVLNF